MQRVESQDRKLEIAKKKERLEQLRQSRLGREFALKSATGNPAIKELASSVDQKRSAIVPTKQDIDNLVNSLIGPPKEKSILEKNLSEMTLMEPSVDQKEKIPLVMESIDIIEFLPIENVTYSKEIQTDPLLIQEQQVVQETTLLETTDPDISNISQETTNPSCTTLEKSNSSASIALPELDPSTILNSDAFSTFFEKSSKIVERALNEEYDIFTDYSADQRLKKGVEAGDDDSVGLSQTFFTDRLTKNRCITSLDWSPFFPELALVSYNKNTSNMNDSDGLILVWNRHMPSRPEFILYAQSEVTVARFSPFNQSIIVGGTYSGQILIWDTKTKTTPILSTSLSLPGHSHPVYSLAIVGTHNAHNLITASTDGVVCSWQMDILAEPQELTELLINSNRAVGAGKAEEVAVTCLAFSPFETSFFFVGTEERNVYQVNRFDRAASKAGIEQGIVYSGHQGAITGISFYPFSSADSTGLFLTSSVDWSVKLWKVQTPSSTFSTVAPLKSFDEADDYIADVSWSPSHPAIFATVDGSGNVDIYNLNKNSDVAIRRITVPNYRGINKLRWAKSGDALLIGCLDGTAFVYDVSLLVLKSGDEAARFQKLIEQW